MDMTYGGVTGDWGSEFWPDASGTTSPGTQYGTTVANSSGTGGGSDQWTGFWQGIIGNTASYLIAKDAAQNGITTRAPNGAPQYLAGQTSYVPAGSGVSPAVMIAAGAVVVGAVVYAATR